MTDGWRGAVALGLDDLILIPSYYRVYKRVVLSKKVEKLPKKLPKKPPKKC